MALQILGGSPQRTEEKPKEDNLDKVMKALNVAQQLTGVTANVYGIREAIANRDLKNQQKEAFARKRNPESDESQKARELVTQAGMQVPADFTAADAESPLFKLINESRTKDRITPYQRENLDIRKQQVEATQKNAQARLDANQIARDQKHSERLNTQVQGLTDRAEKLGLVDLGNSLKTIQNLVPGGIEGTEDIPGVGATGYVPRLLLSSGGKDLRQALDNFSNMLLKARSGGAVTPQEAERMTAEIYGAGTDSALRTGLKNAFGTLQAKIKNLEVGATPEALQVARDRGFIKSEDFAIAEKTATLDELQAEKERRKKAAQQTQLNGGNG